MADGKVSMRDDPVVFELAKQWWTKRRRCAFCGNIFTQLDNIGKRECKIHTGSKTLIPWPKQQSYMNDVRPEGKLVMSCCNNQVIASQFTAPVVCEAVGMCRDPVRRAGEHTRNGSYTYRRDNMANDTTTIWSGNVSSRGMINNFQRAKPATVYTPVGCRPCDHREKNVKWNENDKVNVQDFAPMLALIDPKDLESRDGFKQISDNGDIKRMGW